MKKKKVAIGMSGGVDSSVAAYLLKEQGYDVAGFFMKFWFEEGVEDKRERRCCTIEEFMDASNVARALDIPLYTLNFESKAKEYIIDDFISEYELGRTPNPCVRCNQFVKFREFLKKANELGFDYIATGHYAKITQDQNKIFHIERSDDDYKDQTYFLYKLDQEILSHTLFPIGAYKKPEIRKIAAKLGLVTAEKKGSQDLCFIANNDLKGFLQRHIKFTPGEIVDIDTEAILGKHDGLPSFTIGQRKGLGLGGGPWYVVDKNLKTSTLFVTKDREHKRLFTEKLLLTEVNWLDGQKPELPYNVVARTRYNQKLKEAIITEESNGINLQFVDPIHAVTAGQSAVFYENNIIIGGGIIA